MNRVHHECYISWQAVILAKDQLEQGRQRRAKNREDQLREAGQGRFKESLSLFEKRVAADRESRKGNESFKVIVIPCSLYFKINCSASS